MASEVGESIIAALKSMSAVTTLVGSGNDARIYSWLSQKRTIPAKGVIVVELDTTEHMNDLLGQGGLEYHDVNILVRAPEIAEANALAEAIRVNGTDPGTGLAGYSDTPIDVLIDATLVSTIGPTPVTREDGSANAYWDVNMAFTVSQNEVV